MKLYWSLLLLWMILIPMVATYSVQFFLVYPGVTTPSLQYFYVEVIDSGYSAVPQIFLMSAFLQDGINPSPLFTYDYVTYTLPSEDTIQYRYIFHNVSETIVEGFWRNLSECHVREITDFTTWITYNEFFNSSQNYLHLPEVPLFAPNINGDPPLWYDDNQCMTVSLSLSAEDYSFLMDPNNQGEDYVKVNMSFTSLSSNSYLSQIKIRRAGGISLRMYPYSYQVKMNDEFNLGGIDRVFKLKAYPKDYESKNGQIVADKTAIDITYALGAPINYASFVRVFINGINQGIYGMLEKVDEYFAQRRWNYLSKMQPPGNLYKVDGTFDLLNDQFQWVSGTREFLIEQTSQIPLCCPCYQQGCDTTRPKCEDPIECNANLKCCSCPWETNGKLGIQVVDCTTEIPFQELIQLGNSVLQNEFDNIATILGVESYLSSILSEMVVMNADGYIYNRKNYYWYQDSLSFVFFLILYDQDTCFTRNDVYNSRLNLSNWTLEAGLADSPFLPSLLQDPSSNDYYYSTLQSFLLYYYRMDRTGPMFDRMEKMAEFIAHYNPERMDVPGKVYSYIEYFILPLAEYLCEQVNIVNLPILLPECNDPIVCNC